MGFTLLGFRLRALGFLWVGVCVFLLLAMVNSGTNLLYFIFGLLIGALLISFLMSTIALRKIAIERGLGDHAVAGEPADVVYTITNRKRFWPVMALTFEEVHAELADAPKGFVLHIPQKSSVTLAGRLTAPRRGLIGLSEIRLSTAFPFGFVTRIARLKVPQEFVVYPRIGMLNRHLALEYRESIETGTMTSNVRGGADEFYGLREYRAGDNVRAIHWRSSARMRQLMIRDMAANAPPQMIVVLNLRGASAAEGERDVMERAIEVAASLVCYGFFENFAVGLAVAGVDTEIPPSPRMGRDARAEMLRRLATLDVGAVKKNEGIAYPNRLAGRAQWIVVTMHQGDVWSDLVSPKGTYGVGSREAGAVAEAAQGAVQVEGRRAGTASGHTVLALDSADSESWVHFLSPEETLRLLRERGAA